MTAMTELNDHGLPRLPLNLREKKVPIAINFSVIVFTSGILPVLLYFVLKYPAKAAPTIFLSVSTVPFGVSSLFAFFKRLYRLTKKNSSYLPIGGSRKSLDLFQWEFIFGFVLITVIIITPVVIPSTHPSPDVTVYHSLPRLSAMPLPAFLFNVCLQLVLTNCLVLSKVRNPFRISSVQKGDLTRPATYSIIEDIVAVDGNQGTRWREAFNARYLASPQMRSLLLQMGWLWGLGGLVTAAVLTGLIFGIKNHDAVFVIGWIVPWVWAGLTALITTIWVKHALKREAVAAMTNPQV